MRTATAGRARRLSARRRKQAGQAAVRQQSPTPTPLASGRWDSLADLENGLFPDALKSDTQIYRLVLVSASCLHARGSVSCLHSRGSFSYRPRVCTRSQHTVVAGRDHGQPPANVPGAVTSASRPGPRGSRPTPHSPPLNTGTLCESGRRRSASRSARSSSARRSSPPCRSRRHAALVLVRRVDPRRRVGSCSRFHFTWRGAARSVRDAGTFNSGHFCLYVWLFYSRLCVSRFDRFSLSDSMGSGALSPRSSSPLSLPCVALAARARRAQLYSASNLV